MHQAYRGIFASRYSPINAYCGAYRSYVEAAAEVPASFASGWDNAASTGHYLNPAAQTSSFATLFWLGQRVHAGTRITDLGGGVGQLYEAFTSREPLPENVVWRIIEVPAAVDAGRKRAAERGSERLLFAPASDEPQPADIVLASGVLQYLDGNDPGVFPLVAGLPSCIIVNKVALTANEEFWTLQNIRTGITPYRVFNERKFHAYFADAGYFQTDTWTAAEMSVEVPLHPECYVRAGSGFVFERAAAPH
ncbi:MAG: hypothetical protein NVS3B28_26530 [Candidatus Velthaea sp.]